MSNDEARNKEGILDAVQGICRRLGEQRARDGSFEFILPCVQCGVDFRLRQRSGEVQARATVLNGIEVYIDADARTVECPNCTQFSGS